MDKNKLKRADELCKKNRERWEKEVLPLVRGIYDAYDKLLPIFDDISMDCHECYEVLKMSKPNLWHCYESLKGLVSGLGSAKSPMF